MHNRVLGRTQEICRASETVEHAAAHDAGRVGVCVNIHLYRRVHANDTKTSDNLRAVGYLLGAQQKLGCILLPALVETIKTIGRETD